MNSIIQMWCFGLLFLGMTSAVLRFEQLVRFRCEICAPETDECCVGTVIHKDVILTTSYCATSCQSVHKYDKDIHIIKTYKQPRMETKTRHDIALVIVSIDWKMQGSAKLSSVDINAAMGLKAYYPYMDDGNTRMREMTIETCGKQAPGQVYGYHVCGAKSNKTAKGCFQRQGVPLILNGKLLGLTAATNNKLCNDEQVVFNTIDPELAWINSTITELYPGDEFNEVETDTPTPPNRNPEQNFTQTTSGEPVTRTNITQEIPSRTPVVPVLKASLFPSELNETSEVALEENVTLPTPIPPIGEPTYPIFSSPTDAMEWFNQKVRSKLKSGNHSYFVLTTVKEHVYSTPFVDLTA